ncbi:MAG: dihydroxy-acid dehydratase [Chloroflexi bacterium]|nr:dihydroxy-acid dehydratase [Chloroflexota bacterium]
MRSDTVKSGVERAPHRSLLRALGRTDKEIERPFVGVVNSFTEIIPGHKHLREIADAVKAGVYMAGGTPFECNTIGICDGIAMAHNGMKYVLPSREVIADSVELVAQAHCFDALVFIPNCDKIVPGMLMAAARLNIPSVFVSGGPMLVGRWRPNPDSERILDLNSVFSGVGQVIRGEISAAELREIEELACPGCGSCAGMFTANTMNCLTEALGMALPGNGTIPAVDARRIRLAKEAGMAVMGAFNKDIKPLDVITSTSLENAFTVDMALGGSTNSVLHLLAVAHEAGVEFPLKAINGIGERTPHLCKISPSGSHHIEDLDRAGGIPAVMKEVRSLLDEEAITVEGRTVAEVAADAVVLDHSVIRPFAQPYSPHGGLTVLFGNLAPDGAVVKSGAMAPEMFQHSGPARVFDSEEAATAAIVGGEIHPGDVVVIRYEGPKGGPGMREMLSPTSLLTGMRLDDKVALITDGRFSGASRGAAIGHVSPEAAARGPIAALQEGDTVKIDVPGCRLDVQLDEAEITRRLSSLQAFQPKISSGYLRRYAEAVTSASTGAVYK